MRHILIQLQLIQPQLSCTDLSRIILNRQSTKQHMRHISIQMKLLLPRLSCIDLSRVVLNRQSTKQHNI
jgi:hypothetical protein